MEQKKPVAIVLGGTSPHAELCRALKKRGYYTILVDYHAHPPAKPYADEHVMESTLDKDAVLHIARDRMASLIIATCVDQANATACYVLEKLGKHSPYSYKTAVSVSNKISMKSVMLENRIRTSQFICTSDSGSKEWDTLKFPLIVKPCDSNGSKGVRRCDGPHEVSKHLPTALSLSRSGKAVVEEFIEGREIAFDSYVMDGRTHILMTRERRKIRRTSVSIQQIYGSFWPADLDEKLNRKLTEIGDSIARAFRLENTPLMVQAIVDGDNISVIEFAPRIGGGENYAIIKMATGFDLIDAAIDSYLGEKPLLPCIMPQEKVFLDNYLYAGPCEFGKIVGLEELFEEGAISAFKIYKKTGFRVGEDISSNNRVGSFVVTSSTQAEGIEKIQHALSHIQIYDSKGVEVFLREIY